MWNDRVQFINERSKFTFDDIRSKERICTGDVKLNTHSSITRELSTWNSVRPIKKGLKAYVFYRKANIPERTGRASFKPRPWGPASQPALLLGELLRTDN